MATNFHSLYGHRSVNRHTVGSGGGNTRHGSELRLVSQEHPWQRGYLCCHPLAWVSRDIAKQRLYRYFRLLCLFNSIAQWITIPVIPQNKRFLLVVNTTSIPCILQILKHVEKFILHNLKKAYKFTWGTEISFPLHCKIYIDNCFSTFIIYCIVIITIVQLQLIPQVHYINNATSHNKYSHAIHTNLIFIEHSCKRNEMSNRLLTWKQLYNGII
jgi:hypothetical protein